MKADVCEIFSILDDFSLEFVDQICALFSSTVSIFIFIFSNQILTSGDFDNIEAKVDIFLGILLTFRNKCQEKYWESDEICFEKWTIEMCQLVVAASRGPLQLELHLRLNPGADVGRLAR